MEGTLQLPAWLVDFWTIYGDMITPVLVTLVLAIVTAIALKIKTDAKLAAEKAELQIQALKEVSNREDNKPELTEQRAEIAALKDTVSYLSEMFSVAFQNSNLSPEIKETLLSLANKIKYGTEEDLVKEQEATIAQLKTQIAELLAKMQENKTVIPAEQETKTRTRR